MDKLTAIKIKYDDGTYSDEIPVSVLSKNVEWDNTHTLVDVLGSINVDVTGTIQGQINQLFNEKVNSSELAALKSRIDNFTKLESGSTTGDAELADIRVGADGMVYDNAGDAVRQQVGALKGDLVNFEDKTFNVKRQFLKHGNGTDGFVWLKTTTSDVHHYAAKNSYAYNPITLKADTTYYFRNVHDSLTYFVDLDGSYIGQLGTSGTGNYSGDYTPTVDCYAYVSINKSNYNTAFLSDSEKQFTEWEEGIVEAKLKLKDAELQDIRVGADGKTYATAGDAVREQVGSLKDDLVNFEDFEDKTFNVKRQFLKHGNGTDGFVWLKTTTSDVHHYAAENSYAYNPITLKADTTYYFRNVHDSFTYFVDLDGSYIGQLGTSGTGNYSGDYTPTVDCYAYVSINKSNYNTAFLSDSEKQFTEWEEGIVEAKLKTECLENESITTVKCDFFTNYEQVLKASEKISGSYWTAWGKILRTDENSGMYRFPAIKLKKDVSYSFIGVMGYYTFFFSLGNTYIGQLTSNTANMGNYEYTPTEDCYVYVSCHKTSTSPMLVNSVSAVPKEYVEGVYQIVLKDVKTESDFAIDKYVEKEIVVKTDGSGDYTSVISAVAKANELSSYGYSVNVKIYDGEYDLLNELGGETWLSTIQHTGIFAERQGLRLDKNVNLIGIGRVILKFQLPNTVTYVQSQCTSCLNLYASNKIENIEFIAQNCRYVCHDECNGGNPNLTRYVKNCKFTHLGNANGLWEYPSVMGGGCGGGSSYDWINCQFYGETYGNGFSYHTNSKAKPSHFNIDGCVSKVSNSNGESFGCHYYGTNHDGNTIFNFKNCTGNGIIRKRAETQDSLDHIKMFVNGYVQTDDI